MNKKSSAHYQREFRKRLRDQGLVKKEVWIRPENTRQLSAIEKRLRESIDEGLLNSTNSGMQSTAAGQMSVAQGEVLEMSESAVLWTTKSLYEALVKETLFSAGDASIEMIEGAEPSLCIIMQEFGDLPVFLTVVGEQIIVESVLWSMDDVKDLAGFNEAVLRTHKYFPLSTISLDAMSGGKSYYHMFGALSATSLLSNVVLEIEVLASNVIQATEAYSEFLSITDVESA